jgi:UDP-N-acetylglucosamine 2-epimerase
MEIGRVDKGVHKILLVAGARPNFMKIALVRALNKINQTDHLVVLV